MQNIPASTRLDYLSLRVVNKITLPSLNQMPLQFSTCNTAGLWMTLSHTVANTPLTLLRFVTSSYVMQPLSATICLHH